MIANFDITNLSSDLIKSMEAYVHDEVTGIPFIVLETPDCEAVGNTVLVVCNDFFENFLEYIPIYKRVLSQLTKTKIILFNFTGKIMLTQSNFLIFWGSAIMHVLLLLCFNISFGTLGQAFTLYQKDVNPNNEHITEQLDGLLNNLEEQKRISLTKDQIKFIGYGYGANVLLYYCTVLCFFFGGRVC